MQESYQFAGNSQKNREKGKSYNNVRLSVDSRQKCKEKRLIFQETGEFPQGLAQYFRLSSSSSLW